MGRAGDQRNGGLLDLLVPHGNDDLFASLLFTAARRPRRLDRSVAAWPVHGAAEIDRCRGLRDVVTLFALAGSDVHRRGLCLCHRCELEGASAERQS